MNIKPGLVLEPFGEYKNIRDAGDSPYSDLLTVSEKEVVKNVDDVNLEEYAFWWTKQKIELLLLRIHRKHGKTFFDLSKKFHENYGRAWIFLRFSKNNWLDVDSPHKIQAIISNASWDMESQAEQLEMLYNMKPQDEYMLSLEITNDATDWTYFQFATVVSTKASESSQEEYLRKIEIELVPIVIPNEAEKWRCRACFGLETHKKLKKCSRCLQSRYCSPKCQKDDWSVHKDVCDWLKKLKEQREAENL